MSERLARAYASSHLSSQAVMATAPIVTVYPFLQRFFVRGALIASIKGQRF
ncbi:hypothetical protein PAESOLCIP111_01211 [Paenibacillus solanacearum]|uniref:Carbohydrate ABC transporter permease n=1 Tax=Paenibacillus solanacearum TaxID=2048548 RepID=A0A916JY02_9BACL|nr:hypothetical protein [Paenibacillus solanacearum]CAG7609833.1 hypothetical protein PAESOLCIP111_01211 [Paenibacillus solanacearum]